MSDPIFQDVTDERMILSFPAGPLACNCTLFICRKRQKAAVIDPSGDAEMLHRLITEQGASLEWILHTHAHFDHCLETSKLADLFENDHPSIALHPDERSWFSKVSEMAAWFGIAAEPETVPITHDLFDGQHLSVGDLELEVVHTPGHSEGSVCFSLTKLKLVVVGDVIFQGSIGRTDLPGGSFPVLERSIREKIYTLPDETTLIPGHGPVTSVGIEKITNPFVQI